MADQPSRDRREDLPLRTRFDEAIESAAETAAQQVAQIHRRRLVKQSFLAALCVSTVVAITCVLVVTDSERSVSRTNLLYDCRLLTRVSSDMSGFVNSDAALRLAQAHSKVTVRLLRDLARTIPVKDLQAATQQSNDESTVTARRWQQIAGDLAALGATNCQHHLSG